MAGSKPGERRGGRKKGAVSPIPEQWVARRNGVPRRCSAGRQKPSTLAQPDWITLALLRKLDDASRCELRGWVCAVNEPQLAERFLEGPGQDLDVLWSDYLDRALVVPVLGVPDAAFFQAVP